MCVVYILINPILQQLTPCRSCNYIRIYKDIRVTASTIHKIKTNLRLFVGVTLLAVIALSVWDIYSGRRDVLTQAERQSADYARILAEHTESAFAETSGMLREIVYDITLKRNYEKIAPLTLYQELRRQLESTPQVGALFLVNRSGEMFTNTQEPFPPRSRSVADRDYFINYLNHPDAGLTIGKPVMSRLVNRWRFNLMRPLNKPGQSFNGLIAAAFEVDYYERFLSQASIGPRGRILLVRNDGAPLVIQPYVENAYQTDLKNFKLFQDALRQKTSGTYHVAKSALDNADRIISYHRLSRFPIVAIVSLHEQDVLMPWVHRSIIQSSLTLGLCLLVFMLTRTMLRHLDTLQAMQTELDERTSLLAASVHEQRIILNNVSAGIGFIKNRAIQWSNALHDTMFGYEPGQTKGMNTCHFYADSEECRRIGNEGYDELSRGGIFTAEVTMKRADGTLFPCFLAGQAIDPEKPNDGSIWVIQDVSEIKRGEIERLSLLEQVQHARHLENIGTLAGGVAHDFNNLLMVIQGAVDLSIMKLQPQSPVQAYLEKICMATQRAADLCHKMLLYSGHGMYRFIKMHPKTLLAPVYDQFCASSGSTGVVVTMQIPDDLPHIKADPNQLRQAVSSVINNAVEAIGNRQGTVDIRGYCEVTGTGSKVVLEVADNGCGMDEDTLQRVFDPFFSTKFTGRGLDMAAVSGVVKALKGTIDIQSHPGKGTVVRFILPACVEEDMPTTIIDTPKRHESNNRPTILFVDDDEMLREMTGNLLDALGYAVISAGNGREALRIYAAQGHSIDLLLLDMTMPEMDGTEVLNELRQRGSRVPALLSSGYGRDDFPATVADEEGLVIFIQKPYTIENLKCALDKVMVPVASRPS